MVHPQVDLLPLDIVLAGPKAISLYVRFQSVSEAVDATGKSQAVWDEYGYLGTIHPNRREP